VTRNLVKEVEDGLRVPSIESAKRLAEGLEMSPSSLVFGIEVPPSEVDIVGVGIRLAEARSALGLSKADLARAADVARSMVFYIEEGASVPSVEMAEALADALDVSPAWLAYGQGPRVIARRKARKKG
jgi:transcriptional regulator with XRE-family HTH domain